jgi:hypothetical protein
MNSLSDQLLKAGLVTQDQVKKAAEKPKRANKSFKNNVKQNKSSVPKKSKDDSDLAQFYKQRARLEKDENQELIRKKQEAAKLKKETNDKINKLIAENILNDETAEIRYNFIVGTTIKYLFVTEKHQNELAEGKIAITFLGGKRALVSAAVAEKICSLNPNKIVIFAT